jgi:hypothetical protein
MVLQPTPRDTVLPHNHQDSVPNTRRHRSAPNTRQGSARNNHQDMVPKYSMVETILHQVMAGTINQNL